MDACCISYIDLMPCRYEQMTFSEKEYSFSFLHKIWGMACSMLGAGFDHMWITKAQAKNLCEHYKIEKWSKERLAKEIKREATYASEIATAHSMRDYLATFLKTLGGDILVGLGLWGLTSAGVISGVVMIPGVLILFILLLLSFIKMPLNKFLINQGFQQMVKGYLEKITKD